MRWNALCYAQRRRGGTVPMPNGPASTYRTFAQQSVLRRMWCSRGKCGNAAVPGTSNHGEGTAVDTNQGWVCDAHPEFGWDKSHSDAPWEPWHRHFGGSGRTYRWRRAEYGLMTLRRGSKGPWVKFLQQTLRGAGFWPRKRKLGSRFGPATRRAVKRFQKAHHLKADGVVGPATWKALFRAYDRRHRKRHMHLGGALMPDTQQTPAAIEVLDEALNGLLDALQSNIGRIVAFVLTPILVPVVTALAVWLQNIVGVDLQSHTAALVAYIVGVAGAQAGSIIVWLRNRGHFEVAAVEHAAAIKTGEDAIAVSAARGEARGSAASGGVSGVSPDRDFAPQGE